jgi:hypothetical protein
MEQYVSGSRSLLLLWLVGHLFLLHLTRACRCAEGLRSYAGARAAALHELRPEERFLVARLQLTEERRRTSAAVAAAAAAAAPSAEPALASLPPTSEAAAAIPALRTGS